MSRIKDTIKIQEVKHQPSIYIGNIKGFTIWVTCENLTNKSIDIEVTDFYLVQDVERAFDYVYHGYLGKSGTLLPLSKKTLGRIWSEESLLNSTIKFGDYVVMQFEDKTNKKIYFSRYDYDGSLWKLVYCETRILK